MKRRLQQLVILGSVCFAFACGTTVIDNGGHGSGGEGGASGSSGTGGTGATPSPGFLGEWKGYVEGYDFDDGTNTLTLTLDSLTPVVTGHVRFGEDPLLPPATDPDVGYPPAFESTTKLEFDVVVSGFWYMLENASFDGKSLKFQVMTAELWKDWCGLQPPVYDEQMGKYLCGHSWGMSAGGPSGCTQKNPDTGETLDINCSKLLLCEFTGVCTCNAESCAPNNQLWGGPTLEIQLVPPEADGDVGGLGGSVKKVYLKKQ